MILLFCNAICYSMVLGNVEDNFYLWWVSLMCAHLVYQVKQKTVATIADYICIAVHLVPTKARVASR